MLSETLLVSGLSEDDPALEVTITHLSDLKWKVLPALLSTSTRTLHHDYGPLEYARGKLIIVQSAKGVAGGTGCVHRCDNLPPTTITQPD